MIKAIETKHNGYKFRSRLEARWAVFFDEVGIKYEYEKEGFQLSKDIFYLPDFYLPQYDCWFEVKPFYGDGDEKASLLSQEHRPVIVASGNIGEENLVVYCSDLTDSGGGYQKFDIGIEWFGRELPVFIRTKADGTDRTICDFEWKEIPWVEKGIYMGITGALENAYEVARSKRFEFNS